MNHLSQRMKTLFAATLAAVLIASSVTACSPRNTEEATQDSKGETHQSLPKDSDSKKENIAQENQEGGSKNAEQPKEANKNTDRKKQESSQDAPQAEEEQALTETQSDSTGSNKNTEPEALTQEQKDFYISQYISMNPFTFQSWSDPETIESFRFGTFYGHNAINDPNYSPEQYAVKDTPNYEIPQAVFEEFIQRYFDVSSEYLRTSRFYDAEKEIYTGFLAGGGAPTEYEVESAKTTGSIEEITYRAVDENGETKVTIGVDHSGDHFKFVSVKRE